MAETPMTRIRTIRTPTVEPPRGRPLAWLLAASLPMLAFLLLPLVALVLRIPLAQLLANLTNPEVAQAISLSIITTGLTVALTLLFGTPVAYLLARRRFRGHIALDTLIDLPMVLPPSVAGIALLVAFGRRGLLGQYLSVAGIELAFTSSAVVLAQLFVAAPFYIKAAATGFAGVDRELEQAAALDGASARQVFRYVTAPLAWAALFGGAVMTWARALGEFGATIIFAGNFVGRTQTMPLAIYQGFEQELTVALTLSVILLTVSFAVLFIVKGVLRQQL
ncbi:MAG: molybdate ABC transporter permease subunit [Kouleothrix sp.]|nr:molybdate ABC transporter permease subunit [Kouleothrix sp.]